mmetsp:Transcript_22147/g.55860  ORF Transcript_22147/g.55860 Transcript_22147/m.55860 type:complete len:88 (+) Transcript_22147:252-515(+)
MGKGEGSSAEPRSVTQAETINPLDKEERRLHAAATAEPPSHEAMAAYGRFLEHKRGDAVEGGRWQRRAVDLISTRLSTNLYPDITYW